MTKKSRVSTILKRISNTISASKRCRDRQREEQQKELNITFGEQDALDILSYAGLEENVDYLCIDGVYMRTLFISGYPFVASSDWMDSLIHFNHDIDISYHLHEVDARAALPKLNRKITELKSMRHLSGNDSTAIDMVTH